MNFQLNNADIVNLIILFSWIIYELFTQRCLTGFILNTPKYKLFRFVLYGVLLLKPFFDYGSPLSSNFNRVFFQNLIFYGILTLLDYSEVMTSRPVIYDFVHKSQGINKIIKICLLIFFMISIVILLGYK